MNFLHATSNTDAFGLWRSEVEVPGAHVEHLDPSGVSRTELSRSLNAGKTMTAEEYEKLPAADRDHFMQCPDCREMFDLRSSEDVVFHLAHHQPQRPAFHSRDPLSRASGPR